MAVARRVSSGAAARAVGRGLPRVGTRFVHALLLLLTAACLVATARAYLAGALAYVDNGDGYYLYAAHRVAQGAVLYRQVMGTQPPLLYALGAVFFKLGGTVAGARLVSAAMRALTTVLVYLVTRQLFEQRLTAALAALIYSLLPVGLIWDRSFDVNPPLTLLTLLAALPLVRGTPRSVRLAGALAALALFTKNLYLPVLAATLLYLALRRRRALAPYLQGLVGGLLACGALLYLYAGASGVRDAFLGQQSSPFNPSWFVAALAYVTSSDGGVILVALAGAALCYRASREGASVTGSAGILPAPGGWTGGRQDAGAPSRSRHTATRATPFMDYAPWLLGGAMAVLLATLKEGTAGPVFQLAEPAVAALAAYAAMWGLRVMCDRVTPRRVALLLGAPRAHRLCYPTAPPAVPLGPPASSRSPVTPSRQAGPTPAVSTRRRIYSESLRHSGAPTPRVMMAALALPVLLTCALLSLAQPDGAALAQNNGAEVARLTALISAHARPGATIVAPPYYALLTGTRLPGDAGDTYILAQRVRSGDPWAARWLRNVTAALRERRIPIVLIDQRLAAIAPLMDAVNSRYHIVYADTLPPALHVTVWLPDR